MVTSPEARVQQDSRMSGPFLAPSAFSSTGDLGLSGGVLGEGRGVCVWIAKGQ